MAAVRRRGESDGLGGGGTILLGDGRWLARPLAMARGGKCVCARRQWDRPVAALVGRPAPAAPLHLRCVRRLRVRRRSQGATKGGSGECLSHHGCCHDVDGAARRHAAAFRLEPTRRGIWRLQLVSAAADGGPDRAAGPHRGRRRLRARPSARHSQLRGAAQRRGVRGKHLSRARRGVGRGDEH